MTTKNLKEWKRSRYTTGLIGRIRAVIRNAGYDEECGIVPLSKHFSVVVRKGDDIFNVRIEKSNFKIADTFSIEYQRKKERITRIIRRK